MQIDRTGVTPSDLAAYKTYLQEIFRAALGDDLILDDETPQGQLIGLLALGNAEADEVAVAEANGLSLDQAIGFQLDAHGSVLNIRRIRGTRSTVSVTLTGTNGTIIEEGALAKTTQDAVFALDERVVIPSSGSVTATMRARDYGPVAAPAGSLTQIVTVVSGWTSITNATAATPGRHAETDLEYVKRYREEIAVNATGTMEAIEARVRAVEGVTDVRVEENDGATSTTVRSIAIAARSVVVVVEGGADADVARAILAAKPAGIATVGTTSVTLDRPRGPDKTINFYRVVDEPIALTVNSTIDINAFPSNGIALIRERCIAWFAGTFQALAGQFDRGGLGIGEDLDTNRLLTPIQSVPGHKVTTYPVTLSNGIAPLPTTLALNKRYTLAAANIIINLTT